MGGWINKPTSFSYQWKRCNAAGSECADISKATNSTYTPLAGDVGLTLAIKVTATNSEGSASATSLPTGKVKPVGEITKYELPGGSEPWMIASGPDGRLWFTDSAASYVSKMNTQGALLAEYPIESPGVDITAGPDGNLWVAATGGVASKVTTGGEVTNYSIEGGYWGEITSGPGERLWLTNPGISTVEKISTAGKVLASYSISSFGEPVGITLGPDGNMWFGVWNKEKIGKITEAGTVTEYSLPAKSGQPEGITTGPDGNLWFVTAGNKVGKITTAGVATLYSLPSGGGPTAIVKGPDGNMWFTERSGNRIGRITTGGAITEFALPAGSAPTGLAVGSDLRLWFANWQGESIGAIVP